MKFFNKIKIIASYLIMIIVLWPFAFALSISDVTVSDATQDSARIRWHTDEASDSNVYYDTNKPPQGGAVNADPVTDHSILLTALQPNMLYYFAVKSGDTIDDYNGNYYAFRTTDSASRIRCSSLKGDLDGDGQITQEDANLFTMILPRVGNNLYDRQGSNLSWTGSFSAAQGETKTLQAPISYTNDFVVEMQGSFDFSDEDREDGTYIKSFFRDPDFSESGGNRLSALPYVGGQLPGQTKLVSPGVQFLLAKNEFGPNIRFSKNFKGVVSWASGGLTEQTNPSGNDKLRIEYFYAEKSVHIYWNNALVGNFEITDESELGANCLGNGFSMSVSKLIFEKSAGEFRYYTGDLSPYMTPYGDARCADVNDDRVISQEDLTCLLATAGNSGSSSAGACTSCVQKGVQEGWYYPFEVCMDGIDNDCDGSVDVARAGSRVDINWCECGGETDSTWCWDYPFFDLNKNSPGINDGTYGICMSHSWEHTDYLGHKASPFQGHIDSIDSDFQPDCTPEYNCQFNLCFGKYIICSNWGGRGEWKQMGSGSVYESEDGSNMWDKPNRAIKKWELMPGNTVYPLGAEANGSETLLSLNLPSSTSNRASNSVDDLNTVCLSQTSAAAQIGSINRGSENPLRIGPNGVRSRSSVPGMSMDNKHYIGEVCSDSGGQRTYYGVWGDFLPCEGYCSENKGGCLSNDGWDNNCLGGDAKLSDLDSVANTQRYTPGDFSQYDLPNVAGVWSVQDFMKFMESSLIKTLTDITMILYGIGTVANIFQGIIKTLAAIWPGNNVEGRCYLPAWGRIVCVIIKVIESIWAPIYAYVFTPMITLVMCQSKGSNIFWSWCNSNSLTGMLGTEYKLDPFENIYTAVGCLCPTAILFNLRKLYLIYQTFDCCMTSSCSKGISVKGCYNYLDKATCMYWEGSIADMVIDVIFQLILQAFAKKVVEWAVNKLKEIIGTMASGILALANVASAIPGLIDAYAWLEKQFDDPKCEDLLAEIGMDMSSTSQVQQTAYKLQINNQGVYTSTS